MAVEKDALYVILSTKPGSHHPLKRSRVSNGVNQKASEWDCELWGSRDLIQTFWYLNIQISLRHPTTQHQLWGFWEIIRSGRGCMRFQWVFNVFMLHKDFRLLRSHWTTVLLCDPCNNSILSSLHFILNLDSGTCIKYLYIYTETKYCVYVILYFHIESSMAEMFWLDSWRGWSGLFFHMVTGDQVFFPVADRLCRS